ncbi:hypothetical protein E3O42_05420 [Cryobacterium adonitolivorans]|uniref:Uncharacterized protein n=1 Tax=Cryobacterium adonitolivorans TaxID=1259189 RepID=A0A4R8W7U2_9MICO|nr:DUF6518 family protein [Cryobacterium adonitolivorans]TFC04330.1 hypothetical protein E3O42_05420 [Cryobacterium adonitolivorans]
METLETSRIVEPAHSRSGWWHADTRSSALRAAVLVIVGGVLIGGLTSFAQQYLPPSVNSLSNSAGGWTMFSFLIVWLSRARPLLAGFLGIVVFQLLVESYSVVAEWRGFDDGDPFTSIWTIVGLVAGPLLGVAASLVRYAPPVWRALAVTPLSAVLLGEGIWALNTIADTTSPVYWTLEIVLSVVVLLAAILHCGLTHRYISLVVSVWLVGTLTFVGMLVFILN